MFDYETIDLEQATTEMAFERCKATGVSVNVEIQQILFELKGETNI